MNDKENIAFFHLAVALTKDILDLDFWIEDITIQPEKEFYQYFDAGKFYAKMERTFIEQHLEALVTPLFTLPPNQTMPFNKHEAQRAILAYYDSLGDNFASVLDDLQSFERARTRAKDMTHRPGSSGIVVIEECWVEDCADIDPIELALPYQRKAAKIQH